jgi:hypothetical protein
MRRADAVDAKGMDEASREHADAWQLVVELSVSQELCQQPNK